MSLLALGLLFWCQSRWGRAPWYVWMFVMIDVIASYSGIKQPILILLTDMGLY